MLAIPLVSYTMESNPPPAEDDPELTAADTAALIQEIQDQRAIDRLIQQIAAKFLFDSRINSKASAADETPMDCSLVFPPEICHSAHNANEPEQPMKFTSKKKGRRRKQATAVQPETDNSKGDL